MKCVKNGDPKKGKKGETVDYGGATSACDNKRSVRRSNREARRSGSATKGLVNESNKQKKKSLNTGSSKKRYSDRIVKKKKPSLVERIREKRDQKKKDKERDLGRYVSPRYM